MYSLQQKLLPLHLWLMPRRASPSGVHLRSSSATTANAYMKENPMQVKVNLRFCTFLQFLFGCPSSPIGRGASPLKSPFLCQSPQWMIKNLCTQFAPVASPWLSLWSASAALEPSVMPVSIRTSWCKGVGCLKKYEKIFRYKLRAFPTLFAL